MDDFYVLNNESTASIKELLNYANNNAKITDVSMRGSHNYREKSDKTFEELLESMEDMPPTFCRVIYRRQMNLYLILYDELHIDDIVEIGVRGMRSGNKEYFIMSYLDKEKITEIQENYKLRKI
jgi:hypothetical protein